MPARSLGSLPPGPGRARATPWREAHYAALDFETTGLDMRTDTIVSFGVVPVERGRAQMRAAVHQFIEPHVPPSPTSQRIHELRPADLAGAPRLEEARANLAEAIAGRFLLVWFADVEVGFLAAIFGGGVRHWRRRTIDVRNLAISVDGAARSDRDRRGYGLTEVARRWHVPVANPHEALDDALVTAQLFLVLAGKLPDLASPTTRDIVRAARS